MVDIYLKVDNSNTFLHFLSIPLSDIHRLSIRPLKWIRFVAFSICGSHGHLRSTTAVNALPVDYNNSNLVESSTYYYIPEQPCAFINQNGLTDQNQITSPELTQQQRTFCQNVKGHHGQKCVFTGERALCCDATHIIPRSKGDKYIHKVIQLRSHLYEHSLEPAISGINDVQNGIFLESGLHSKFGQGYIAFLKTPNFALNPDDIPRVGQDPTPPNRTTLQQLQPPVPLFTFLNSLDFHSTGNLLPPTILLDYMYGVAAYNCWKVPAIHPVVNQYFSDNYKSVIPLPPPQSEPSGSDTSAMHRHHNSHRWGLEKAMKFLMMYINGIIPQVLDKMAGRGGEVAQEESQAKVEGWLQRFPVGKQPPERAAKENT
ncbi:hypothetical protein JOM56_011290 [Amanita muscaria]